MGPNHDDNVLEPKTGGAETNDFLKSSFAMSAAGSEKKKNLDGAEPPSW